MLEPLKRIIKKIPGADAAYGYYEYVTLSPSLPREKRYDAETFEVIRRCCGAAIDVGAHKGTILKEIVKYAPRGRHVAVEALPHLAADLRRRFPTVSVLECAVSDSAGEVEFVHAVGAEGFSGLRERDYDGRAVEPRRLTVRMERLDDVVPRDARYALMKLDIEGGEFPALRGAEGVLRDSRPVVVFEFGRSSYQRYDVDPREVAGFFDALGYRLTLMGRWLSGAPGFTPAQFVEEHRKDFYFLADPQGR